VPQLQNVDLLYHEATFTKDLAHRIDEGTYHSTAEQAAMIAKKSNAKQLIIGHFSVRYGDLNILLQEAKEVFENTVLAIEGQTYPIV
jgi:ribonuclease Z